MLSTNYICAILELYNNLLSLSSELLVFNQSSISRTIQWKQLKIIECALLHNGETEILNELVKRNVGRSRLHCLGEGEMRRAK